MRIGAMLLPAFCVIALLPTAGARADVASCREALQRMAQTYHLSVSPTGPSAAPAQPSQGGTAEAPATTESRGMTAGADSLASSGGTLPPSTSSVGLRGGVSEMPQLGAVDRAKAEGLLSEAQAADAQGNGDQCLQSLRDAQAIMQKARP